MRRKIYIPKVLAAGVAVIGFVYLLVNVIKVIRIIPENTVLIPISQFLLLICFIVIVWINIFVLGERSREKAEYSARDTLDLLPYKMMDIEEKYADIGNAENQKMDENLELQKEVDYIGFLDSTTRFLDILHILSLLVYIPVIIVLEAIDIFVINIVGLKNILLCGIATEVCILIVYIFVLRLVLIFNKTYKHPTYRFERLRLRERFRRYMFRNTTMMTTEKTEISISLYGRGQAIIVLNGKAVEIVTLMPEASQKYTLTNMTPALKIIDIKGESITGLECSNNKLTSLDVSSNPALTVLWCDNYQLTSLDISKNPVLEKLFCENNGLTSLDVSTNPALKNLGCWINNLTSLDVSKNPALTELDCSNNSLTNLDVSKNPALEELSCWTNNLTSLDVSKNPALSRVNADTSLRLQLNPNDT